MLEKEDNGFQQCLRYGFPALVLGMPTLPLLIHLPILYAEKIGLGLSATGIAIFVARLIDIFTDPLIGSLSDQTDTLAQRKWGRRKPIILIGGILGILGTIFLLNPATDVGSIYLALWATILYLGWTMINIPYLAWGAALSDSYNERTKITSFREGFMLAGIMLAGAIPALSSTRGINEQQSMALIGWIMICLGVPLFTVLLTSVKEPPVSQLHQTEKPFSAIMGIRANTPFVSLLVGWIINGIANGIPAALFILYLKHVLGANELERGLLTLCYFLAAVTGVPIWLWLSQHIDKHKIWSWAMGLSCLTFAWVPLLENGDITVFFIITILTGITLGADMILPPSMQADIAEFELVRSGHDRTGLLFSFWSMATKLALALSILIAFPLLEVFGFSTNKPQIENNLTALSLMYSIVPVALKIISILIISRHPLNAAKQNIIRRQIIRLEKRTMKNVTK